MNKIENLQENYLRKQRETQRSEMHIKAHSLQWQRLSHLGPQRHINKTGESCLKGTDSNSQWNKQQWDVTGFVTKRATHTQLVFLRNNSEQSRNQEASLSSEGGTRTCTDKLLQMSSHSKLAGRERDTPQCVWGSTEPARDASRGGAHRIQFSHLKESGLVTGLLYQQTYSNFLSMCLPSVPQPGCHVLKCWNPFAKAR